MIIRNFSKYRKLIYAVVALPDWTGYCDRIELGTKKRGIVGIAVIQPAVGGGISEIRKRAALGEYHGNF
jgi:hypothetical protein